jgi:L-cysteate sulfo-lyase
MKRLSAFLGGPALYIKRDDCTGLGGGGNKTRKLEFLVADALEHGADTLLTIGAVQSNHVRQTAAAAAHCGLACHALLETEVPCEEPSYQSSGNVLLDGLFDCELEYHPHGTDMDAAAWDRVDSLRAAGRKPCLIPVGGSNGIGALGYAACAEELAGQFREKDLDVSEIVLPTGSGGTHGGLLAGLMETGIETRVTGVSVSADKTTQFEKVRSLVDEVSELIGLSGTVSDASIHILDRYVGESYGIPTDGMREAVALCARLEGILLDPVYTGKAMAGLIDRIRLGELGPGDTVVFLHTGGSAGLFAYDWYFNQR